MDCFAASHFPTKDPKLDEHWNLWKSFHSKKYHEEEEDSRRLIWEKNLKTVTQHNLEHSMGKHSYRLGMNHFGDMTNEEFRQIMNGYQQKTKRNTTGSLFMEPNFLQVPSALDWRDKGYVTPVKDQHQCGSCWAFGTTGSLEGQMFRKTGKLVSLSEQNLMDCSRPQGNGGCNGGLTDQAFTYVKENKGLDSEESYPYLGMDQQQCLYNPMYNSACVTGFVDIPSGDEAALMKAVTAVGPVSVADAGQASFQFYQSGIYYDPSCSSRVLNHGVLVVGYVNAKTKSYWVVKNSWGTGWGIGGYMWLAKDQGNLCGIASLASYPKV
uniref:Uncharacterized protein n=1 Tax=Monopterus albus TaxID=43700 RepID=A0A3Q3JGR2_MONAL